MNQTQVIHYVKEYLVKRGYHVSASPDGYGAGVDIDAKRDDEEFLIEAVGETRTRRTSQDIIIAIGETIKRMKEKRSKVHYGIAVPKSHLKYLKDFEVGGIQVMKLHLFVVETISEPFGWVYHLDTSKTIELVQHIKTGKTVYLSSMDIEYQNQKSKENTEVIKEEKPNPNY